MKTIETIGHGLIALAEKLRTLNYPTISEPMLVVDTEANPYAMITSDTYHWKETTFHNPKPGIFYHYFGEGAWLMKVDEHQYFITK